MDRHIFSKRSSFDSLRREEKESSSRSIESNIDKERKKKKGRRFFFLAIVVVDNRRTMERTTFGFVSNSHFVFSAGNRPRSIGGREGEIFLAFPDWFVRADYTIRRERVV